MEKGREPQKYARNGKEKERLFMLWEYRTGMKMAMK
jgi:hypothetical protein